LAESYEQTEAFQKALRERRLTPMIQAVVRLYRRALRIKPDFYYARQRLSEIEKEMGKRISP